MGLYYATCNKPAAWTAWALILSAACKFDGKVIWGVRSDYLWEQMMFPANLASKWRNSSIELSTILAGAINIRKQRSAERILGNMLQVVLTWRQAILLILASCFLWLCGKNDNNDVDVGWGVLPYWHIWTITIVQLMRKMQEVKIKSVQCTGCRRMCSVMWERKHDWTSSSKGKNGNGF